MGSQLVVDARGVRPKGILCHEVTRRCFERFGDRLRAVVLTGSLARDEATFVPAGEGWTLLGDADFLLVFHEGRALPRHDDVERVRGEVETGLASLGVHCHTALSAVRPAYLRKLRPAIFTYELRACGQVLWGDPTILSLIPSLSVADIPLEDAWRLLANRIIEQLEVAGEQSDRASYRTLKLYLDMATSLLVFAGGYAPTYAERLANLTLLARSPGPWPFPLLAFAEDVARCTRWKLAGGLPAPEWPDGFWQRAVDYAHRLWRWELIRLTGMNGDVRPERLLERWMQLQPARRRLRGWLYVLRKQGWHRSWRHWPRWARLARRASPRYWVYAVAGDLLPALASLLTSPNHPAPPDINPRALLGCLPAVGPVEPAPVGQPWRALARHIVWNYKEFLVETRA